MTESATNDKEDDKEEGLKDAWGQLVSAIEWELRGVTDRFWDGWPDERLMGRREGPAFGWTQTLPPRVAGQFGEVDPYMHARNRLTELMHLARGKAGGIGGGELMTEGQKRKSIGTVASRRSYQKGHR